MNAILQIPELDQIKRELAEIKAMLREQATSDDPELWTVRDVARYLKVTEKTVRNRVRAGTLETAPRCGSSIRFVPSVIKAAGK